MNMGKIIDFLKNIFCGNRELTKEEEQDFLNRLIEKIKES